MLGSKDFSADDLPDLPYARQLKAGFPWLIFDAGLEPVYRQRVLEEHLPHVRVNLCISILAIIAISAVQSSVLGPEVNHIPSILRFMVMIPAVLVCLAASFSQRRHVIYPPVALICTTVVGLCVAAVQLFVAGGGAAMMFPAMELATIFIYFMGGLVFYHALAATLVMTVGYIAAGTLMQLPPGKFGYEAITVFTVNLVCASVAYMHEKTSRMHFLEAALLKEMVARDGLTGIQNRRMFDQHILRAWNQAVRDTQRIAVLLADIDCFKDYNDRYGHQAGDECLRAVAVSLSQCARRPLDFVARYGGEEFAVVLYEASREYVAEVLTRIQRSIAELNIPHEASTVASRLTLSIGAALILPSANRTHEGLIQLADEALYSAKEQGRNRVVVMEAEYQTLRTGRFERRSQRAGSG
jgi:diguanylate cyclase (GGDEF)-like protein